MVDFGIIIYKSCFVVLVSIYLIVVDFKKNKCVIYPLYISCSQVDMTHCHH